MYNKLLYDKLVVAMGRQASTFCIPGVKKYVLFPKEAEDDAKLHMRLLINLKKVIALSQQEEKYHTEINMLLKVVVGGEQSQW